jgi:hypothetical protein
MNEQARNSHVSNRGSWLGGGVLVALIALGVVLLLASSMRKRAIKVIDSLVQSSPGADGRAMLAPSGSAVFLREIRVATIEQIVGVRADSTGDSLMMFLGTFADSDQRAAVRADSMLVAQIVSGNDWRRPLRVELTRRSGSKPRPAGFLFLDSPRTVIPIVEVEREMSNRAMPKGR